MVWQATVVASSQRKLKTMREMKGILWIYVVTIFLSEAWSRDPDPPPSLSRTNNSTSLNSNTSADPIKVYADRNSAFNLGSDANLTCSNKTWNETLFVIWDIQINDREPCKITFSDNGHSEDTCNDGKSLRNTSSAQSYLHIPNFSTHDVGVYKCESVYRGGNENYKIHVAITARPIPSAWLEHQGNKMVAVCKAEGGNPAANISWSNTGNSVPKNTMWRASDGFFTVESRVELPEVMNTKNLTCTIRHQYWDQEIHLKPELEKAYFPWRRTLIVVVIAVFLVGFFFFAQKKLILLRRCRQSDISPSKFPPTEDVEEVEPYASYIQRVNSIYN